MKIGTDIVNIKRFESLLNNRLFLEKVYSNQELKNIYSQGNPQRKLELLAGRFSAKEAFLKAIEIGIMSGIPLKNIEVLSTVSGKPYISLDKSTLMSLKQKNILIKNLDLSISHTKETALAVVILNLETQNPKGAA
ncbi:holo-ACP synthase [Jeotgalibacillus proteolyticus]|uniref:Holo-[acyl-carrier-protein] synthase n=1 Tax=Jeotgalibacillus proteolyticus TaxID=2082395 RepID=A0A2S5G735_9BACL|nr:holo-ACP synthase [Jeotgalibacillus proteolyticus]PPA68719.1 holo-[acyl-carrier-protein] synthase [Jeotgalibacillus proteolyticus]PPA68796.1 holo-[acyl-carrier-protein] synthase [Jeotgalibacillus proteolyticus]